MNIPLVARALLGLQHAWPGLPGSIAARPRERRHAPWGDLDGDHRSMLARLYGGGATLDRAPALDTEWWWCAIDAITTDHERLSIVVDVQIFVLPGLGPQTNCTVAIRNLATGQWTRARANGKISCDELALFKAEGFGQLGFEPYNPEIETRRYEIEIDAPQLKLELVADLGRVAYFGDADQARGWFDNNPKGSFPLWINYRSRFGHAKIDVCKAPMYTTPQEEPDWVEYEIDSADIRFDQESVHWGLQDIHDLSLPAIAELTTTMPRWVWVDATVTWSGKTVHVTAFRVYNGNSGALLNSYVGACDDDGQPIPIDPTSLVFRNFDIEVDEDLGAAGPDRMPRVAFDILELDPQTKVRPVRCKLVFDLVRHDLPNETWVVSYPLGGPVSHRPLEVPAVVRASFDDPERPGPPPTDVGTGLIEIFDLRKSLRFSEQP
jgi:hypothetical protein